MSEEVEGVEGEVEGEKPLREQLKALLSQYNIPAADLEKDLQAAGPEHLPPPTEEMLVLGRMHYMLLDNIIRFLVFNKYQWAIPAYAAISHLLRTSNFDPWDIEPMKWTIKEIIDTSLFAKGDFTIEDLAFSKAMYVYGFTALKDALDGWRGKLVTERAYRIEGEKVEKDRRRWWERIFGR